MSDLRDLGVMTSRFWMSFFGFLGVGVRLDVRDLGVSYVGKGFRGRGLGALADRSVVPILALSVVQIGLLTTFRVSLVHLHLDATKPKVPLAPVRLSEPLRLSIFHS